MGKSKSRILHKGKNNQITTMSRDTAIAEATKNLNNGQINDAKYLITMFGLNAEELLEAGASYEAIVSIKNIFIKE